MKSNRGALPESLAAMILGIGGVAAAAYGAHGSADARLANAVALVCLGHAPVLVSIALVIRNDGQPEGNRLLRLGGWMIALGALVFSADLGLRMSGASRLFANAAPAGGIAMMAGWLVTGVSGMMARKG